MSVSFGVWCSGFAACARSGGRARRPGWAIGTGRRGRVAARSAWPSR